MERLIQEADHPRDAMDLLAMAAERGGLINNDNLPRRTSVTEFVMDLLTENPLASDWINCRLEALKPPDAWTELDDLAGHLL